MAKKDTISALQKRGVSEEVATVLVNRYSKLSEIAASDVSDLIALGIDAEVAKEVLEKVGPARRSTKTRAKATVAVSEDDVPAAPTEEYSNPREMSETEIRLVGIMDRLGLTIPFKVIADMADRIKNADLSDEICEKLVIRAHEMYESHRMVQNEAAGGMAAHSSGEPGTQMNLRTFHFAGVASISVTQGLPRLLEIVDARREPSTPSMNIPLVGLAKENKAIAEHVGTEIEITNLLDVASVETDLTNMRLLIIPNPTLMDKRNITVDDIVERLNKIKAVRGYVEKTAISDSNVDGNIVITMDPATPAPFTKLLEMYEAIKNARLKGVEGIDRALVQEKDGICSIITEGSNLEEVLKIEGIDRDNVMTNSIAEVADVFGIEAARNSIIYEATSTLKNAGLDVDIRHIMLVADLMTNDGTVRAIGRNGVSGKKSSVLARAAFEITAAHLLHAAMVGEVDNLEGVTENIIVGQPVTLGTGAIKLYYDPKSKEDKE
ncbi:MAG: DNA-directed RNA polymerase subunit A'' [archaeon]|nr:DNA-directed RNA polymerase subunit A'' [archaeon]